MATTHGDHSIRITDLGRGVCTRTLTGHPRTPWSLQFHPIQKDILASGCLGGEVRVWDLHVSIYFGVNDGLKVCFRPYLFWLGGLNSDVLVSFLDYGTEWQLDHRVKSIISN